LELWAFESPHDDSNMWPNDKNNIEKYFI